MALDLGLGLGSVLHRQIRTLVFTEDTPVFLHQHGCFSSSTFFQPVSDKCVNKNKPEPR